MSDDDPLVDRVESAVGRLDEAVERELAENPAIYETGESVLHGTTSSNLESIAEDGALRPGDETDGIGEDGEKERVSVTTTFGPAEYYAHGGTPSLDEIVPVDAVRAGVEDLGPDDPSADELLDRAEAGEDPEATAATIVDLAEAGKLPLVPGIEGERAREELTKAVATEPDFPVVVEATRDAVETVEAPTDEVPVDPEEHDAVERVEGTDEELWELPADMYFEANGEDLPEDDVETLSEITTTSNETMPETGAEVKTTGVDLTEGASVFVPEDRVDEVEELFDHVDAVNVGTIEARSAVRDYRVVQNDALIGRMQTEISYRNGVRELNCSPAEAPDLVEPESAPTPPPDHDPAPGHVARDWHARATGEESIEAFSKPPDWTERTQAFEAGGVEVEVFDPEYDGREEPITVDGPEVESTGDPGEGTAEVEATADGELVRDELAPRVEDGEREKGETVANDRGSDVAPENGGEPRGGR